MVLHLVAGVVAAQAGPLQRSAEHERLAFLEGDWDTLLHPADGSEALPGRVRYEWDVGGVWLIEHYSVEFPKIGTRHVLGAFTFDARERAYVGYSIDNLSARITIFTGEWLGDDRLILRTPPIETASGDRIEAEVVYSRISTTEVQLVQRQSRNAATPVEVARVTLRRRTRSPGTPDAARLLTPLRHPHP
jgi:hypothetical protein